MGRQGQNSLVLVVVVVVMVVVASLIKNINHETDILGIYLIVSAGFTLSLRLSLRTSTTFSPVLYFAISYNTFFRRREGRPLMAYIIFLFFSNPGWYLCNGLVWFIRVLTPHNSQGHMEVVKRCGQRCSK